MIKKMRTILFSLCVFFLFLGAPVIILYSCGYRFDFDLSTAKIKIVKTGGFYCKVIPKNVEIHFNGKFKEKTDFFFDSVFIKNLLPIAYDIEISKQGHYSWKKSLEIEAQLVTEAKNVILIPQNPEFTVLKDNTENFWFLPNQKKLIIKKTEEQNNWVLEILNLEKNNQKILLSEENILNNSLFQEISASSFPKLSNKNIELLDLKFSSNSEKALLETLWPFANSSSGKVMHLVLEIDDPSSIVFLDFLDSDAKDFSFNAQDSEKIFFTKFVTTTEQGKNNNFLFSVDYNKKEISESILSDLIAYKSVDDGLYWLSDQGFLLKSDSITGKILESFNLEPLAVESKANYAINNVANRILIKENNVLYFLDESLKKFKKISEFVRDVKLSPDNKKIVFLNNFELWVFFFEEENGQPKRQAQEKVFLTRFSEKIGDCFWFGDHYLVFSVGDKIKIAEIDDRSGINMYNLAEFKNLEMFFNSNNKRIYILSDQSLYNSKEFIF